MGIKYIIIIILLAIAIIQEFELRFKKFLLKVAERREKELLQDKIFWENMYKNELENAENKKLNRDENKY